MKERIITGLIMIAVILGILFFIPILFMPLIAIVLGIATWEWCRITQIRIPNVYYVTVVTIILWILASFSPNLLTVLLVLSSLHYLYAIYLIQQYEKIKTFRVHRYYLRICGPIILAALGASLVYLFHSIDNTPTTEDAMSLTFIIMIVAAADTGAYFTGRFLGKHQLAPRVSPKKTIEGLIGGLIFVVIIVLAFQFLVAGWFIPLPYLLFISLVTAIFSVIGDLFISVIKRQNHIKDASQILPGHGGILDRIDGMIAGIPVFYLLQQIAV